MVFSSSICVCFCLLCSLAPIIDYSNDASILAHEEDVMETSVISQALNKVNPLYTTILGQPFEGQGIDMSSDRWVLRLGPNLLRCDVSLCVKLCLHLAIEEKFRG